MIKNTRVIVLHFLVAVFCVHNCNSCAFPNVCDCSVIEGTSEWKADCSGRNLTSIPMFLENVTWINLDDNNINKFPKESNFPRNSTFISLNSNKITQFMNNPFVNLNELIELNLGNNRINLSDEAFPKNIFKDLFKLRRLRLKNIIKFKNGHYSYPDKAFQSLVALEYLEIDGFNGSGFGTGFQNLRFLTHLDVSGSTGHCEIKRLHPLYFKNLFHLKYLDLSNCDINQINKNSVNHLLNLTYLDISYNSELTFRVLKNLSTDLKYTKLEVFKFDHIHCTFGLGTEIYIDDFVELRNSTTLKEMSIGSNRLQLVESGFLANLPRFIEKINVSDNTLTMGMYALQVSNLQSVRSMDLSMQFKSHSPREAIFQTCKDSKALTMRACDRAHKISAQSSEVVRDNKQYMTSLLSNFPFMIPANLEVVYFNSSTLQYELIPLNLQPNRVKEIYLQNNILYRWTGPYDHLENLEVLDLSYNYCDNVSISFFKGFLGLKKLIIGNNMLGFSLGQDMDGLTFKDLSNLEYFDLSRNQLYSIPKLLFKNLNNLTFMNLSGNYLQTLDLLMFHNMKNLRYLDISYNQIQFIDEDTRSYFDTLMQSKNLTIDLSWNIQLCDNCKQYKYLAWLFKNRFNFKNFKSYICRFSNGTSVNFENLQIVLGTLKTECTSYTGLIVGGVSCILIFVSVVIFKVVYRYRWKIRYLYYIAKSNYQGYTALSNDDKEDNYLYDAFVSYADDDRQMAFDMLRFLEDKGRLKLCLHQRDFIPGRDIAENITQAIHNSRKVICIISTKYLNSYWCMFEVNMARMEEFYSRHGQNIILLVLKESDAVRDIPLSLMNLIEDQTYLEYTDDPEGNVVFWRSLKRAVQTS